MDLVLPECANTVWKAYYRRLISLDSAELKIKALIALVSKNVECVDTILVIEKAFEIATQEKIIVYDAL